MKLKILRRMAMVAMLVLAMILAACQAATPAPTETSIPTAVPTETTVALSEPTAPMLVLEGATTTESGLQYMDIFMGNGAAPKVGDIITMMYIVTLPDGTELANSYTQNQPLSTVWGFDNLLPGWEEGVGLMKVNGKAKLVIPPDLAFGAEGSGVVPPNSQIVVELELLSAEPSPQPTSVAEAELITTDSGLQYYDLNEGEGVASIVNNSVTVHYTLWVKLDTGYQFIDTSIGNTPIAFIIGRADTVFPGWEEGATGMKVGGKRFLIIPPALGLGEQGLGAIPPNAVLVMEIEMTDVREPLTATKVDEGDYTTTESGLKYYDLTVGTGEVPSVGSKVVVHYTGWLEDGTQFDSSVETGQPFTFVLGQGAVIPGWDEGLASMKVGGKRQLVIPPDLGYGDSGAGNVIPPGATLIFEVELIEIQP